MLEHVLILSLSKLGVPLQTQSPTSVTNNRSLRIIPAKVRGRRGHSGGGSKPKAIPKAMSGKSHFKV